MGVVMEMRIVSLVIGMVILMDILVLVRRGEWYINIHFATAK